MFDFKYKIEFKNKEVTNLFGEDYYCDKSTFWNSHQTTLNDVYKKVLSSEFPLTITDLDNEMTLIIHNQGEFEYWMTNNQPFTIPE